MSQGLLNARAIYLVGPDGTPFDPVEDVTPEHAAPITPNNSGSIGPYRAFSFAVAGDIKFRLLDGTDFTLPSGSLAVGLQHALWFDRVYATGTAATGICGYR